MDNSTYPIRFDAKPDDKLSRLLIFVKFFALIPHFFVLYFLMMGFFGASVIAWFAILFTGKYPPGLFKFSVGVQRWRWRMRLYLMLLTDKYPPFSLDPDPEFPGTFEIDYPEHSSRLLIFVKYLLAIPHFIVLCFVSIAFFVVLCLAWLAILFTGKYPSGMATFVVGFLRWRARVSGYLMLMTDVYPPFSLE